MYPSQDGDVFLSGNLSGLVLGLVTLTATVHLLVHRTIILLSIFAVAPAAAAFIIAKVEGATSFLQYSYYSLIISIIIGLISSLYRYWICCLIKNVSYSTGKENLN